MYIYRAQEAWALPAVKADLGFHCASVGEVLSGSALVLQWQKNFQARRSLITHHDANRRRAGRSKSSFAEHRYLRWTGAASC